MPGLTHKKDVLAHEEYSGHLVNKQIAKNVNLSLITETSNHSLGGTIPSTSSTSTAVPTVPKAPNFAELAAKRKAEMDAKNAKTPPAPPPKLERKPSTSHIDLAEHNKGGHEI